MKKFKVLIPQSIHNEGIKLLKENKCEIVYPKSESTRDLIEAIQDCDAVLVRTIEMSREVIENASTLKIIARHGVGLDNVDIEAATDHGVYVCNAPDANINSVAEHTVGLINTLFHQILKADHAIRQGNYSVRNTYIGTDLKDKKIGLIGLGNIGNLVAKKCAQGFEMNVIAYDPYVKQAEGDHISMVDSIDELLQTVDVVSLHMPYKKEFHHFIGESELKQMKKEAFLINVARGGLVDETALYQSLKNGELAGAGLDCFEQEPTPKNHPLFELDNVVLTPHMAAHTKESMVKMAVHAAEEIIRLKTNQELKHPVNSF